MTGCIGDFGRLRGNSAQSHGRSAATSPNAQAAVSVKLPPCYYGCGDYPEWIQYEGAAWRKEQRMLHRERFAECVDVPPDIYSVVDGRVVSSKTGKPFPPIHEQIAALMGQQERERARGQRRADRATLKPLVDLYSILGGA